jgi:glutaredoxin 2
MAKDAKIVKIYNHGEIMAAAKAFRERIDHYISEFEDFKHETNEAIAKLEKDIARLERRMK